jgi:hypothetical protein
MSSDFQSIVEVGWIVMAGDPQPQLFVYHWIDGQGTCYDACGWVQVSTSRVPGMTVSVSKTRQEFGIEYTQGSWWISYQNEMIGYFPGTLWNNTYTHMDEAQWFGEVSAAANHPRPCTQMGDGIFGTKPRRAAEFSDILMDNSPPVLNNYQPEPSMYKGALNGNSYSFGGPGGC